MKTYIVYQNGKLTMKEKGENKKKVSNFILKTKQNKPQSQPQSQSQHQPQYQPQHSNLEQSIQKNRSMKAPPQIESLKNTYISPITSHPAQSGGKKRKINELQLDLFSKLCNIINIDSNNLIGKTIPSEKLQNDNVIHQLYNIQDKLKNVFPSSKLTALHTNAIKKQSFPGVNIVRQIFKEMGYKLRPVNTSLGYSGTKKILRREYHIEKL